MEYRPLREEDAEAVSLLEASAFSDGWQKKDILEIINSDGAIAYCATCEGEIASYVIGRQIAPEGEIYRIATATSFRRRGVARALLKYAVVCEKSKGLEKLFLEVRSKNTPAISLYESLGFTSIDLRKNYYKNPNDDAVIMMKSV